MLLNLLHGGFGGDGSTDDLVLVEGVIAEDGATGVEGSLGETEGLGLLELDVVADLASALNNVSLLGDGGSKLGLLDGSGLTRSGGVDFNDGLTDSTLLQFFFFFF